MADRDLKELRVKVTFDMASLNKSASELKSTLSRLSSDLSKSFKIDLSNAIDTSSIARLKNNIQQSLSNIKLNISADTVKTSNNNVNNNNNNNNNKPSVNIGSALGGAGSIVGAAGMGAAASGIKDAGNTLIEGGKEVSNGAISVKSSVEGFNIVIKQLESTLKSLETIMNNTNQITSSLEKLQELQVLRSYTKDALNYAEKIRDVISKINSGEFKPGDPGAEDYLRTIRDISDNIIDNFKRFGDFKFVNGDEAKALISDLKTMNEGFKGIINNKNLLTDFSLFGSNDKSGFGSPDPSIDGFIKNLTDDLNKAISAEEQFKKYSEDMAKDVSSNLNLLPPNMNRIKEEAALLEQAMKMDNTPESGVGFLKALQNIENAYKGTLSSIKAEDLAKLLNDKFNITIDPSSIKEFGNNMNATLNLISRDTISVSDSIENIADAADLSAGRIALAMRIAFAPLQSMRELNPMEETTDQISSSIQNSTGRLNQFFNSCSNGLREFYNNNKRTPLMPSLDQFSNSAKNFKSSLKELVSSVKQLFGQNDQTTNNNIDKMDNKAKNTHSTIKGLVKSLAGMFGLYKVFSIFKQGTSDAIQYEAAIMQIENRLGGANNALVDFINNQAGLYSLSKKQAAEFSNIYSIFVSDITDGARSIESLQNQIFEDTSTSNLLSANAELTKELLQSVGTIAMNTGYDINYVLQGIRSGIMG